MSWNDSFEQGFNMFGQGKYEEALIEFNEAILENSKEVSVYVYRAAVFEMLDRPEDALEDFKKVIDLVPGLWQGYAQSAHLLAQIKKPEASLEMLELALERLELSDEERRVELDALKQRALKELESPPCFFSKLPVEICGDILTLVADKSSAKTLALTRVCRNWREIILNMTSLWQRLVLTRETSGNKVDAWLQRSKGTLSSLEIRRGFDFDALPNVLRYASESFWTKLESLKVHLPREIMSLCFVLPPGILAQLQLQELEVDLSDEGAFYFDKNSSGNLDLTRLSSLVLRNACWSSVSWKCLLQCTVLRTLEIHKCKIMPGDVLPVLAQNPLLETLILVSVDFLAPELVEIPEPIELVHLRYLHLVVPGSTSLYLRCLRFPNLGTLSIERAGSRVEDRRYLDMLVGQPLPNLMDLRFTRCSLERQVVLIPLLQSALKLQRFAYCQCTETEAVNTILTALAEPASSPFSDEKLETNERPICCPRLQHLDFTGTVDLKVTPIMRLVKAHLPPAPSEGDSGADLPSTSTMVVPPPLQLPIRTLILYDCKAFDRATLPWMQAKVPYVRYTHNYRWM
ncbi:hypothetical protein DFH11DRAFT_904039 [Phellopilus nigrolimitatus]|nr:hypothetical protein DFH11DRAFT_904039 [Phellopilus nigrolimitatus]